MEAISKNKPLLKVIFTCFDTRQIGKFYHKIGRIDAC